MTSQKTLKEQNSKLIWTFFAFNAILLYVLAFSPIIDISDLDWKEFISIRGIWLLIIPLVLFILNGLLSSNQKASICFWRLKHPLPGCRAFSVYMNKDDRIDKKHLNSSHNALPELPQEQNAIWYKMYKAHQEESLVKKSHKDFLLARDICSISLLFLLIGGSSSLFLIEGTVKWAYIGFALLQYLVLALVTQNHGKRFVCNVLAIETSKTA